MTDVDLNDEERTCFIGGIWALYLSENGHVFGGVIPELADWYGTTETNRLNMCLAIRLGVLLPYCGVLPEPKKLIN